MILGRLVWALRFSVARSRTFRGPLAVLILGVATPGFAQRVITQPSNVVSVSKGASALLVNATPIQRFSVGEPTIAEATVISPTEVLINGKGLGTTTLFIWDSPSQVKVYSVEVTADAPALQRYLRGAMPDEQITVSSSGNSVTLSGSVKDANSVARAVEIAKGSGAAVIDNLVAPAAVQVMLQVRFAEINRTALKAFSARYLLRNPQDLSGTGADYSGGVAGSDGTINFLMANPGASINAAIRYLQTKGDFRSLAEPNLMTLPGREATFLAGGRFPFPTLQTVTSGSAAGAVTITFEEFGVRLKFTPTITRSGAIRLKLEPEVSSLDFANGLVISGFSLPTILTRRASTEVEMREGQYLAIAGLLDNTSTDNVSKIPILGDIPILGQLFRSKDLQQRRTELLVLISPRLVTADDVPTPVPTGEPKTWDWLGPLKQSPAVPPTNPLQPASPAKSAQ
ncbi:MAG: type II and III secretion system protein family protein [Gemmatimonadales bacterium]|nr:type II and III secretion system protein family protein [Gemmatimonadales bacterium]